MLARTCKSCQLDNIAAPKFYLDELKLSYHYWIGTNLPTDGNRTTQVLEDRVFGSPHYLGNFTAPPYYPTSYGGYVAIQDGDDQYVVHNNSYNTFKWVVAHFTSYGETEYFDYMDGVGGGYTDGFSPVTLSSLREPVFETGSLITSYGCKMGGASLHSVYMVNYADHVCVKISETGYTIYTVIDRYEVDSTNLLFWAKRNSDNYFGIIEFNYGTFLFEKFTEVALGADAEYGRSSILCNGFLVVPASSLSDDFHCYYVGAGVRNVLMGIIEMN